MNRKGDAIRIAGMVHIVIDVQFYDSAIPTYILIREFDGSFWYIKCHRVTRFSHLKRIPDQAHANLDKYDVMTTTDIAGRRI